MKQLFRELKRRNVYKVAVTYVVVAFVGLQAVDLLIPATTLPSWADAFFLATLIIGFPVALVLAWAFELTPEGVQRTANAAGEIGVAGGTGYRWIGLAIVVLLAGGVWYATAGDRGEPAPESAAAADTARAEAFPPARSVSRDRPFVAVLPLENLSPNEENAFFADGIHEEILGQLSKVSGLGVFGRTTMRQYADTEQSIYEIGRELNARAVLEGSVRRAAGRVRITTQLIDPQSRDHFWSETYERELTPETVFDIQADIAQQIANALEARLTEPELERIEDAPTSDLAAYDAYLKGQNQRNRVLTTGDPAYLDLAIEHFREAIRRDSTFVDAYAGLGNAFANRYDFVEEDPRWLDSASAYVDRARALDPNSTQALATQAYVHQTLGALDAAERGLERILELDPNADVAGGFSDIAFIRGDAVEAVRWAHRAVRRDPRSPWLLFELGTRFLMVGMTDPAEAWFRHALELDPDNYVSVQVLTELYLARGDIGRARTTLESFRASHPEHLESLGLAAQVALRTDNPGEARAYLETLARERRKARGHLSPRLEPIESIDLGLAEIRTGSQQRGRLLLSAAVDTLRRELRGEPPSIFGQAFLRTTLSGTLAALGEREEALAQLERSAEGKGGWVLPMVRGLPVFDQLRSEPRFRALLQKIDARQEPLREEVRQLDLDLYPPGAEPNSTSQAERTSASQ